MSPRHAVLAALVALGCGVSPPADPVKRTEPDRCGSCHLREFRRARRPPHVGQRPSTCAVCHVETAWRPTTLVHAWPLTGAHLAADCFACHTGTPARLAGTPTTCWGCHERDFRGVRFAAHARYAHTCRDCHSTRAWQPAREDDGDDPPATPPPPPPRPTAHPSAHSSTPPPPPSPPPPPGGTHPEGAFPIARGNHAGIRCERCHSRPGPDSRANTDCVQCHSRSRWDPVHEGVGRYPTRAASPNFCVSCHRRGTRSRR